MILFLRFHNRAGTISSLLCVKQCKVKILKKVGDCKLKKIKLEELRPNQDERRLQIISGKIIEVIQWKEQMNRSIRQLKKVPSGFGRLHHGQKKFNGSSKC